MRFWLQFLWLLPATMLVYVFYILPLWILRYIEYHGMVSYFQKSWHHQYHIPVFVLTGRKTWYQRAWSSWWGWSGPMCMIIHDDLLYPNYAEYWDRTVTHEATHCAQQLRWGIFFYPVYLLRSIWIFFFQKTKHPYLDNPFEREARVAAGQQEFFTPDEWMHGKHDRWPWW